MKKHLGKILLTVAASLAWLGAWAVPLNPQTQPEPGVWCSDYPAAVAYADANNIPLLVLWANPGCSFCEKLEAACEKADFKAWQAERKIVMVFVYGERTEALNWIKSVKPSLSLAPAVGVYWRENTSGKVVEDAFTGRSGYMPVVEGSLGKQLMNSVDSLIPDWDPSRKPTPEPTPVGYIGGEFVVPGTALAHLEAIVGKTVSVGVPLVRTNGVDYAATNVLVVADKSVDVIWNAGEREKMLNVDTSGLVAGDLKLTLMSEGKEHSTSFIRAVAEPENSTDNPAWFGEAFGFGEWTMDLDSAKAKTAAAAGDAYTLVFFTGAQWCPWCIGLEKFVFASEEFKAWAKANQINLVILDNPKRSPNDKTSGDNRAVSTAANGAAPTLLRYATGANGRSGAAYLSRKGIGVTAAEATLLLNHTLGYLGGAYCAPEALRTGYPTVILLDKAGVSKARLNLQSDTSKGKDADGAYFCDKAENMQRFKDLLVLAKDAEMRENDQYCSTTSLKYVMGATVETTLYVNQNVNVFKLEGVAHNSVTFTAVGDSAGRGVTFAVVRAETLQVAKKDVNGVVVEKVAVPSATTLATGSGTVTYDFNKPGDYYLKVSSFDGPEATIYGSTGTKTEVAFRSEGTPIEAENLYYGTAFTVPVPVMNAGSMVGMLSVAATKKNKVTVKYSSVATGKTISLSGNWSAPDDYGTVRMAVNKGGVAFVIALQADGTVAVEEGVDADFGTDAVLSGQSSVAPIVYARYAGVYTVALPVEDVSAPVAGSTGAGSILIKANTAATKSKGKVTCSVTFPDGKTASATGQLVAGDGEFANLTVFAKSGKNVLTVPMRIRPDPSEAPTHRAIMAQSGARAVWNHAEKTLSFVANCGTYGSIYSSKESLVDCCGEDALTVVYGVSKVADSEAYGAVADIAGAGSHVQVLDKKFNLLEKTTGFKLSFARSTGLLTGSTKIQFEDGKQVAAAIRAVVLPDWHDCGCFADDDVVPISADLPFVLGTCTFGDKVGGKTATRGMTFALEGVSD